MNAKIIAEISKLLGLKFWFGGKMIYPWEHSLNKTRDVALITLDGCRQYKFKVHKNGKLRLVQIYSQRFLKLNLKPLQTITAEELKNRIALIGNEKAASFLQMTSPVPIPVDTKGWHYLQEARRKAIAAQKG